MLDVGLIGLGPEWENRYWPALTKLKRRLRVRTVYTPVITHAEQIAAELDCDVSPGLMALLEREDVRAVLILDTAWFSGVPAQFACQVGKPAFLAGRHAHRFPRFHELLRRAAETGVTLMPDFGHRYTPAMVRVRELIATRLGRPLTIAVEVVAPVALPADNSPLSALAREVLAVAVDWCTCLVGTDPSAVRMGVAIEKGAASDHRGASGGDGLLCELRVEFRVPAAGGAAAVACIRLAVGGKTSHPEPAFSSSSNGLCARIGCVGGTAWIEGPHHVTWESGIDRSIETLISDRPAAEVMLDHFSRRVVGALIPVPTLDDLCRAFEFVDTALNK